MAVTAKFVSDFSSFFGGVEKAVAELKGFELQANKVEKQLGSMVTSFSGREVITQAHLMAKAVEEAGGSAKLTAKEMASVNAVVTEAIAKYTALGQVAPQSMRDLAAATSTVKKPLDDLAAGMTAAGKSSVESNKLVAGMSAAGQEAAKLAANLQQTSTSGGGFSNMLTKATPLLGAFGVSLGVGGLISFGKSLLDDADALQTMSDRTGIGVEGLQRLQLVGDATSVSIEEMTDAINQMQNRLVSGDKSAIAAFEKLNINLENFKTLSPDQQFIAISDALRQVENPAEQVALATDAMGKVALRVLPAMKQGFDDVKSAAVGMSQDTQQALDAVGDKFAEWSRKAKGAAAEVLVALGNFVAAGASLKKFTLEEQARQTESYAKALRSALDESDRLAKSSGFGKVVPPTLSIDIDHVTAALDRQKDAFNQAAKAAKDAADQQAKSQAQVKDKLQEIEHGYFGISDAIGNVGFKYAAVSDTVLRESEKVVKANDDILKKIHEIEGESGARGITKAYEDIGTKVPVQLKKVETAWGEVGKVMGGISEILSGIHGKFAETTSIIARGVEGMIKSFSSGDWIGGIVAGITTAVGAISKLFTNAEKQINKTRREFVEAAGGLDKLRDKATEAGVTINALLNAKNAEQYKKAIDDLNRAFDEHAKDIDLAKELMEEYGISIEETGAKWKSQQLSEQSTDLLNKLRVMVDVLGLSLPDALTKMAGKFQEAFDTARKFGLELPAEMKPVLEKMVELGKLTDENGDVITDLKETGVKFSETFSQSVDRLIEKFDEFLNRLSQVPGLINSIPRDFTVTGHVNMPDVPSMPSMPEPAAIQAASGGLVTAAGLRRVIPFKRRGTDTIPAMLTPGELVLSTQQTAALGQSGQGQSAQLDAILQELRRQRLNAPDTIGRAVRDELQKRSRAR